MEKTIFFDLGNVLLFFSHDKMIKQIAAFCGMEENAVRSAVLSENLVDRYERGALDSRGIHAIFCEKAGKELDFLGLMRAAADIFQPNQEMMPILKQLKHNQVQLILLSNTCEAHFDFALSRYPFLHLFDHFILSYQVRARKPETKIFESALSTAKCSRKQCFYTDDIPEYIQAAADIGIEGEVFKSAAQISHVLKERSYL